MTATQEQSNDLGKAARELLAFGWRRAPRIDLLVTNAVIAVGKTFATDPAASALLLRQAIEADHLREFGYKEIRWIAQNIGTISKTDSDLAVDIYRAAYGYAEASDDSTDLSRSALLGLRSNRRQDYEGAWYLLSQAIPSILTDNLTAGVRAVVAGLNGYVSRRYSGRESTEPKRTFRIGDHEAGFQSDWSHTWYRGGYQPNQDAPVLLKTFDEWLEQIAKDAQANDKMDRLVGVLAREESVPAAMWGSVLVAGTRHPAVFAKRLVPLAFARPIMLSADTRFQLGEFLTASYDYLDGSDRNAIERAISALPSDPTGVRAKQVLAGCLPKTLIETTEMRTYIEGLEQSGSLRANVPPIQFTSSVTPFDTDAYLAAEGVSLDDQESAALRELMRPIEALPGPGQPRDLSLAVVTREAALLDTLRKALTEQFFGKVPTTLFEHATGELAEAASRLARADPSVLADASVKQLLKSTLFFCARSTHPHYDAEHEKQFHESLSWGAPSARTAAAQGLVDLTRASSRRDPQITAAIHKLARDPVPQVRLQIIQNLGMLRSLDRDWIWSEVKHVFKKERTRGVVSAAIVALGQFAYLDVPRAIRGAKALISRYRGKSGSGIATCLSMAKSLLFDFHIYGDNAEADKFAKAIMSDVETNADLIRDLVARYSENLLVGPLDDANAADSIRRLRTLAFYREVTERSFAVINERMARLSVNAFSAWPESDQAVVREMFGILEEVTLRLMFAAGAQENGAPLVDIISPERKRLYAEAKPIFAQLAVAIVAPIAHHLVETLETFIPLDSSGVFALIAQSVRSADQGGYSMESMAVDLIVRIVERYLADYRSIFADPARMKDLIDCLDVFVRAGWPAAQSLTFRIAEIWR